MANKSEYVASGKALQTQHDNKVGPVARHKAFLDPRLKLIAKWVTGGVRPEALMRFALMDMATSPKLAACTPESVYLALLACAVTGLEPGALKGHAYLVPFAGKAQFMIGWKGIVVQARRSREVVGLTSNIVRARDTFDLDLGTDNRLVHKPATGDRGEIVGTYAIAKMLGGHHEIEFLDTEDIRKIRAVAEKRGAGPAWKDWEDQMVRKQGIRRLGKRLPMGDDFHVARSIEDAVADGGDGRDVLDLVTDGAASASAEQVASAPVLEYDGPPDDVALPGESS